MDVPLPTERTYADQYGWVSPFILEIRKYFNLTKGKSPSKDKRSSRKNWRLVGIQGSEQIWRNKVILWDDPLNNYTGCLLQSSKC